MALNEYREEAREFLASIGAAGEGASAVLDRIDEEVLLLRRSLGDRDRLCHQTYDVLFLLFELAAKYDLDLDAEWATGRERKRNKYLNP